VYAEAFTLVDVYLAFNLIPYDELGKATLCQTEGFIYMIPMLKPCSSSVVL
jgi:hypothetical protein